MKRKLPAINPFFFKSIVLIALFSGATSCVTRKKFDTLESARKSAEEQLKEQRNENSAIRDRNLKLVQENEQLKSSEITLNAELTELKHNYDISLKNNENLNQKYEELLKSRDTDLGNLKEALRKLEKELVLKERNLAEREAELLLRDKESRTLQEELEQMKNDLALREKRVNELERRIKAKDSSLIALKKQLSDALIGFENKGITVEQKNGRVYVSMESKLLFQSGRTEVDVEGSKALLQIADALNKNEGFEILIEGHTDNVPIKTARFEDNWDLSVLRATSVVRILIGQGKVNPKRIVPAGRGEYAPVAGNDDDEGKQKNRRIEIVLSPDLSEIFKLLE